MVGKEASGRGGERLPAGFAKTSPRPGFRPSLGLGPRRPAMGAGRLRGGVEQRGVLRGPGMVERVLVVVRRDDEPTDGIGIVGVGKMPWVVRLGLSVWQLKNSSWVSGGRRRGD